ncbi:MAG: DUF3617 domain-containing protein [Nevskia sp.]|nr:DUF3617 domain-containing protein [Nevskia sp.]
MRNRITIAAAAAAIAIPFAAGAYTHGKPGLWQITTQMKFTKGGPQAQIPPDKLAMMKQMGIQMPDMSAPISTKTCVTAEQAATDTPPTPGQRGNCQVQNLKRDGHTFSADTVCSGEMQGTGHVTVTYDSDEHYSGKMDFSGTSAHTGDVQTSNEFSGQWLGTDCGSVKPSAMPAH